MSNVRATKDTDPRISGGFTQIPNALLRSPVLCTEEKLLYGVIYSHLWQPDSIVVTQKLLAYELAIGDRQVRRWLTRLEDLGLVRVIQQGVQKPNIYELPPIPPEVLVFDPPDRSKTSTQDDRSKMTAHTKAESERSEMSSRTKTPHRSKAPAKHIGQNHTVLLFSEDSQVGGASGSSSGECEVNAAREQKINTAREERPAPRPPEKNPDILPLLSRHAEAYRNTVGVAFPVAWAKDGAIVKRLLKTYSRADIELLQDAFFAQKADSQAARRGYTVSQFAYEAAALMTAIKVRESLTDEQKTIVKALCDEGVMQEVAVALAHDYDAQTVRAQIEAHTGRRERFENPAAALVKAIREGWTTPQPAEEPNYFKPIRLASRKAEAPPPEIQALLDSTLEQLTGKKTAT